MIGFTYVYDVCNKLMKIKNYLITIDFILIHLGTLSFPYLHSDLMSHKF